MRWKWSDVRIASTSAEGGCRMTKIFSERLKEARLAKGFSRSNLVEKSGVSYTAIYNIEERNHLPNLFIAICLAETLEVSLDWLAGRRR
jgi:transcriptional regulator with XRE-family HTH domain